MKRSDTAESCGEPHAPVAEVRRSDTFQTSMEPETPAHVRVVARKHLEDGPTTPKKPF